MRQEPCLVLSAYCRWMQFTTNLDLLFAAGTINLAPLAEPQNDVDWHDFGTLSWPPQVAEVTQVANQVSFLVAHGVICATVRRINLNAFVRVYLSPIDLPGVAACFHKRKPNISRQCLNALRAILELTSTSRENWMAVSVCPPDFFCQPVVCSSMSALRVYFSPMRSG